MPCNTRPCWQAPQVAKPSDSAIERWLRVALLVHVFSAGCVGLVASFWPHALLVYASEAQASACGGCALAFDLAQAFGGLNLLVALLAARFLWAWFRGRIHQVREHAHVLLLPMGLSMLAALGLRLCLVASGRFSSAEWASVAVSAFLALVYLVAHRRLCGGSVNGQEAFPRIQ